MLEIKNLYFSYAKEYYILYDVNLKVEDGATAIVVGDKNSGKTSLSRLILGLDKYKKGSIAINNIPVNKMNFKSDLNLGYLPKNPPFLANKSIEDNIRYVVKLRNKNKDIVDVKVNNTLIMYNFYSIRNVKASHLNAFDKYRLAIARLSTRDLDILIVDDIFNDLNQKEKNELIGLIKNLNKNKSCSTLIFADNLETVKSINGEKYFLENGSLKKKDSDE